LRDLFSELDANGDGVLTVEEIKEGLKHSKKKNSKDLLKVFDSIDTDKSGRIDYTGKPLRHLLTIRIPCCYNGKANLLKRRETILSIQAI